jgi:WhiB family redox-sensing transcriptional regulator
MSWQDRAACRGMDPDIFYPARNEPTKYARRVCQGCDVRDECLEAALAEPERFGIWGGFTEKERRLIKRRRLAASA